MVWGRGFWLHGRSFAMPLFHCTRDPASVANILRYGFAYVALPTKTAAYLLPDLPPLEREPQQFGMICFRSELDDRIPERHQQAYGRFAICVDADWAISVGAQPVIYIHKTGSAAIAFKRLLLKARSAIDREIERYPDDSFRTMAFFNRAAAGSIGAAEWGDLLSLFELMGPADDEWEREWRIVNRMPLSSIPRTGAAAVAQVSPPQGWAKVLNVLPIPTKAVPYLVAAADKEKLLRSLLPEQFKNVDIRRP